MVSPFDGGRDAGAHTDMVQPTRITQLILEVLSEVVRLDGLVMTEGMECTTTSLSFFSHMHLHMPIIGVSSITLKLILSLSY